MTTTASIADKRTKNTGYTEEHAQRCHDQLGKKVLAVVELVAEARSEKRNGDESVVLSIITLEPAPNGETEDHLRELARSFHYERKLTDGQAPTLPLAGESAEPNLEAVVSAGQKHRPHPYLASTLSTDDNAICDVCGQHEGAAVHADRSGLKDPFAVDDDTEPRDDEGDDEDGQEEDDAADQDDEDDSES